MPELNQSQVYEFKGTFGEVAVAKLVFDYNNNGN